MNSTMSVLNSPRLLLISAWNESGGGFTHRLFDGHPQCFVYPFEIQMGTHESFDNLSNWFSSKYRWPYWSKPLEDVDPSIIFDSIQDEELKGYLCNRDASKFKDFDVHVYLHIWKNCFIEAVNQLKIIDKKSIISCYLTSFFKCWSNYNSPICGEYIVGHCPTLIIDFEKILNEFSNVKMIHVFRSPYAGFIDFKRRIPSASLETFCQKWCLVNFTAFLYSQKYPSNCHLVRYENLLLNRKATLKHLCKWINIEYHSILEILTWNSQPLDNIYPFGGVYSISENYEQECLQSLSEQQVVDIDKYTRAISQLIEKFP